MGNLRSSVAPGASRQTGDAPGGSAPGVSRQPAALVFLHGRSRAAVGGPLAMLFTLFIVNKSGGLIFTRDLNPVARLAGGNEYMMTASTFHSLHAIAKTLAPVRSGGIEVVDAPAFSLHCFETPTGLKFFVTARTRAPAGGGGGGAGAGAQFSPPPPPGVSAVTPPGEVNAFLRRVYELYADFVLKNPFYELEMPIRTRLFDAAVESAVRLGGLGTGSGGDIAPAPAPAGGRAAGAGAPMFSGTSTS